MMTNGPSAKRIISVIIGIIVATVPFHIFARQIASQSSFNALLSTLSLFHDGGPFNPDDGDFGRE
jgi:hypothetical protein